MIMQEIEVSLEALLSELYKIKNLLWNSSLSGYGAEKRALMKRKDELIILIKRRLKKARKDEAATVRQRMWEDLRVVV